ncbi:MAG: Rrf2 family transcriptional regulator [Haliscomenobacter sp.]|nr:Rrf2 family transcriptional regulator [Haliscomenobacter sp.]MBK8879623.1 Rrf2 family transcriptional regulator [Haliscomenobacter sp.]
MFSKSCKYAIRAVLYMAYKTSPDQRVGVKEISDTLDVPGPFLAKLLQQLTRNNLVSSIKGPNGGFFLSEKNRNEPLRKVVECIDGPEVFSACILGLPVCSSENPCPLHTQAFIYREGLLQMVGKKTVAEIAAQVSQEGLSV